MMQRVSHARRRPIGVTVALGVLSLLCGLPLYSADDPNQTAQPGATKDEVQELKRQLAEQQKQIEELRLLLLGQQKQIEKADKDAAASNAKPEASAASAPEAAAPATKAASGQVASLTPILPPLPVAAAPTPASAVVPPPPQAAKPAEQAPTEAPLQLKLGSASITPVGFMDITNTFRSSNAGTSLQTNFGSFPYNNTMAGRLTEDKWSAENSRIGFRVDAKVGGANVLGYFESDFVGGVANGANNTQVSSNSMLLRIRQYYVDVRHGFWEVLAGQAWSMLLPNRRGMSPLPADLFYSQVVDVNYMNGLYWGRIPGIRFIGHPNKKVAFGIALENSDQYMGGSGGGGVPTLPTALATAYGNEVDNGTINGRNLPNVHPDIIAKFTVDPSPRFHFEVAGVESTVKLFNPNTQTFFTKAGGGGAFSVHAEVVKNLRLVTNNFWSDGEGRYLFGEAPNFIVRSDGSPSLVHSGSTVSGFEATIGKFAPYVYYGGIYIGRNTALDANKTSYIGYGFPGSANGQNRAIQEISAGWTHTIWRDGRYGALQNMVQYAYFFRNPWFVAPGAPKGAHESAVWFNLRYVLPGTAPTVEY